MERRYIADGQGKDPPRDRPPAARGWSSRCFFEPHAAELLRGVVFEMFARPGAHVALSVIAEHEQAGPRADRHLGQRLRVELAEAHGRDPFTRSGAVPPVEPRFGSTVRAAGDDPVGAAP